MPNVYCKDFQKLKGIKIKSEETKQRKIKVLNNASLLYDELVRIYKKKNIIKFLKARIINGG